MQHKEKLTNFEISLKLEEFNVEKIYEWMKDGLKGSVSYWKYKKVVRIKNNCILIC